MPQPHAWCDGYNELSFEDEAGKEQVRLRAQHDLEITVLNSESRTIGNTRTTMVDAHDYERIHGMRAQVVVCGSTEIIGGDSGRDATWASNWR